MGMIWPTHSGDHRTARQGRGPGGANGWVRWRWRCEHKSRLQSPLVGLEHIFVQSGSYIFVLDANGQQTNELTSRVVNGNSASSCVIMRSRSLRVTSS